MQVFSNRFLALIVSLFLMLSMLTGCAPSDAESGDAPVEPSETTTDSAPPVETSSAPVENDKLPYAEAYKLYAPDTAMITVGDYTVTWEQLYYYLCNNFAMIEQNFGAITDWTAAFDGDLTYAAAIKQFAGEDAISDKVAEYGAKSLGAELTDVDTAMLESNYSMMAEQYGGEDALLELLYQNHFPSKDLFMYMNRVQGLIGQCFTTLYGENGANITDAEVAELTADDGYLMAKHILLLTQNDDGTDMTEDEKTAVLDEINGIYNQLRDYEGDDFDAFFDELMLQHSEDAGGLQGFPDGYLFQNGDMVTEFYEACLNLEIGDFCEPVKTAYGYHIVYRMPINYDIIPSAYYNAQQYYSLRYIAAATIFESVASGWQDNVEITYSKDFEALDVVEMFGA